ncbi:MAG: hypothetical protein AAF492_03605 [Verrucomicrobiota bacterium]
MPPPLFFLMPGGFLCLEAGLVRKQTLTRVAMKNVVDGMIGCT